MENKAQSWGLTILRIFVGVVFLVHGYQKLFQFGIHGVAGMFGQVGIPLPLVSAAIVTFVEFIGGILLITGLAARIAAALNGIDMVVAIFAVHLKHGFFAPTGFEYPFIMLGACICLLIAGGGALATQY